MKKEFWKSKFGKAKVISILLFSMLSLLGCGKIITSLSSGYYSAISLFYTERIGGLTDIERKYAQIAWLYFENNYNSKNGLVNYQNGSPIVTMRSIGDCLIAYMAARELELISEHEFEGRVNLILDFIYKMPLTRTQTPNNAYHSTDGYMIDFSMKPTETGWSALDIGRLLISLKILGSKYKNFQEYIDKSILRWDFRNLTDSKGYMLSGVINDDNHFKYAAGWIGDRDYYARGYQAFGFPMNSSLSINGSIIENVYGIPIITDGRDGRIENSVYPITSLPYLLDGMEFKWKNQNSPRDHDFIAIGSYYKNQAQNIYLIQEQRFSNNKVYTAKSSYSSRNSPYYYYDAIFSSGYAWNTTDGSGRHYDKPIVSTAAVFGMWSLWNTQYTDLLMDFIRNSFDPLSGWFEGRSEQSGNYEKTITLTTNSVVLEALWFKANGRIFQKTDFSKTYFYNYVYNLRSYENIQFSNNRILENK